MPMETVRQYLDDHNIKYVTMQHSRAYTAQDIAESAQIPGRHFAKTVMVNVDGQLALAVLPATDHVEVKKLTKSLGAHNVSIAQESDFRNSFPDCELGAMPPFGNLFNMEVFISPHLVVADRIAFNAGTHTEIMQMAYDDFERLVQPVEVNM